MSSKQLLIHKKYANAPLCAQVHFTTRIAHYYHGIIGICKNALMIPFQCLSVAQFMPVFIRMQSVPLEILAQDSIFLLPSVLKILICMIDTICDIFHKSNDDFEAICCILPDQEIDAASRYHIWEWPSHDAYLLPRPGLRSLLRRHWRPEVSPKRHGDPESSVANWCLQAGHNHPETYSEGENPITTLF